MINYSSYKDVWGIEPNTSKNIEYFDYKENNLKNNNIKKSDIVENTKKNHQDKIEQLSNLKNKNKEQIQESFESFYNCEECMNKLREKLLIKNVENFEEGILKINILSKISIQYKKFINYLKSKFCNNKNEKLRKIIIFILILLFVVSCIIFSKYLKYQILQIEFQKLNKNY